MLTPAKLNEYHNFQRLTYHDPEVDSKSLILIDSSLRMPYSQDCAIKNTDKHKAFDYDMEKGRNHNMHRIISMIAVVS